MMNSRVTYLAQFQNNRQQPPSVSKPAKTNYLFLYQKNSSFAVGKFIREISKKLEVKPTTFANAATIFHRVSSNLVNSQYDKFSLATGAIYLASKVCEDPVRLKDIINVSQVTLDREKTLNELGNDAWIVSIRDSIVQCELFIMRVLHFDTLVELPHPYLLHYISTVENWLDDKILSQTPISNCAFSLLEDFYLNPTSINFKPESVAISCLVLTFQIYGLTIPGVSETDTWFKTFCPDLTTEEVWEIIYQILRVYEFEAECK